MDMDLDHPSPADSLTPMVSAAEESDASSTTSRKSFEASSDFDPAAGSSAHTAGSHSPITRLPPELVAAVFAYLDTRRDQRAFLLCCRAWFACGFDSVWYRPFVADYAAFKLFLHTISSDPASLTIPYADHVRRLHLTTVASQLRDEDMAQLAVCRRIERLTITSCSAISDRGLLPVLLANTGIQSIDLSGLTKITDGCLLPLARSCGHSLQGLYVARCNQLTDAGLILLARACPMLKRIKLAGLANVTSATVQALVDNCPLIVELDLAGTDMSNSVLTRTLQNLRQLRELRLASISSLSVELAFSELPETVCLDRLRVLDLTSCYLVSDESIRRIVRAAPRLRNVMLAKCINIGDRGVQALAPLGRTLHYVHLGHCSNISDRAITYLVERCPRIQYVDVACCTQLTDLSLMALAQLPRIKRIGLVKCQNITDTAILTLAQRQASLPTGSTLERIHLSYCGQIGIYAVLQLANACPRLTHLSLTGVPPFMRHDITQFCRTPPPEFTQHQQAVFCVFSGIGVRHLRDYLNKLVMETGSIVLRGTPELVAAQAVQAHGLQAALVLADAAVDDLTGRQIVDFIHRDDPDPVGEPMDDDAFSD